MSVQTRVATPYAKSLLDLARERGQVDAVTTNMQHFNESVKNPDLRSMLTSPVISGDKKLKVLDALFGNYDEITKAFLRIVTEKNREEVLPAIANEYMRIYREEKGISQVKVTSAAPLSATAIDSIQAKLRSDGLVDKIIELETVVDPSLLGGFIIEVGDRYYDASARAQFATLRKEFTGTSYQKQL